MGDFNNDGKEDLVVTRDLGNRIVILLGNGTGGIGSPTEFATFAYPRAVAVGDFNGDGKQDLAVECNSNRLSILSGDGAGNFSAPTNISLASGGRDAVAIGDLNGDGKRELWLAAVVHTEFRPCWAMVPAGSARPLHSSQL